MSPPQPPPPPQLPPPLHQDDAYEEDETVKQLNECSSLYLSLQDRMPRDPLSCLQNCLVNTNRNWRACQKEVQALKACNDRRKNDKRN